MNLASTQTKTLYFSCSDCLTVYPIRQSVFEHGGCSFHCISCQNIIAIHPLSLGGDTSYLEHFSCDHRHAHEIGRGTDTNIAPVIEISGSITENLGDWIEDTVSKYSISEAEIEGSDSQPDIDLSDDLESEDIFSDMVGEMFHNWTVFTSSGDQIEYKTFAELRNSLKNKIISREDEVLNSDGVRVKLADFEGTRDLFPKMHAKKLRSARDNATKRTSNPWASPLNYVLLLLIFSACAWFAKGFYDKYLQRQHQAMMQQLFQAHPKQNTKVNLESIIRNFEEDLAFASTAFPKKSVPELIQALHAQPGSPQLRSLLAQNFVEQAHGQSNQELTGKAKTIAKVLKIDHAQDALYKNIYARIEWRKNKLEKSLKILESIQSPNFLSQMMSAHLYLLQNQYEKATLTCSSILSDRPQSIPALRLIVDVFRLQGKFKEASSYQRQLNQLQPTTFHLLSLVELYKQSKDFDEIVFLLENSNFINKSDRLLYEYIHALSKLGRNSELASAKRNFVERFPSSSFRAQVDEIAQPKQAAPTMNTSEDSGSSSSSSRRGRRRLRRRR